MKTLRVLFLFLLLCSCLLPGCSYFDPDVSKAISEKEQLEEMKKQTAIMERQTQALERIGKVLERLEAEAYEKSSGKIIGE